MRLKGKLHVELFLAFVFGVVFVTALLALAIFLPEPTPSQYQTFKAVLALAMAGVAAVIPGMLHVQLPLGVTASGALGVFVIGFFFSPAGLTDVRVRSEQEIELERQLIPVTQGNSTTKLKSMVISDPQAFKSSGLTDQRFDRLTLKGATFQVPHGTTIVANEIYGENMAVLKGESFSVVAQRVGNITLDVSAPKNSDRSVDAGSLFIYAKLLQNTRIVATGMAGEAGLEGDAGESGLPGSEGIDGDCRPSPYFRGSTDGENGEDGKDGKDGANGGNGSAGGLVVITTIIEPTSLDADVSGGAGGAGGKGGKGGMAGQGGKGGDGCIGFGGSQPDRPDGRHGSPGPDGRDGKPGQAGPDGEYRLFVVKSFRKISKALQEHSNAELHQQLQRLVWFREDIQ